MDNQRGAQNMLSGQLIAIIFSFYLFFSTPGVTSERLAGYRRRSATLSGTLELKPVMM